MPIIRIILKQGFEALKHIPEITNPHLEAELLLSSIIKRPREYILSHFDEPISLPQQIRFKRFISRRSSGTPLAYLTKSRQFYGYDFLVNKNTLIPRPETELLVEAALISINQFLAANPKQKITIIDVGTGTACIPISLALELAKNKAYSINCRLHAIDISEKALRTAKKNARQHCLEKRIAFHCGDLLSPIIDHPKRFSDIHNSVLIITANLPYLTAEQLHGSPSISQEPKIALYGGESGLDYYEQLFKQLERLLEITGRVLPIRAFLEIDESQKISISQLIKRQLPDFSFQIKNDLSGHERLVILSYSY